MKYDEFLELQTVWRDARVVTSQFADNEDCQIVAQTEDDDEYWLMQKNVDEDYIMCWCWAGGEPKHEDVKLASLHDVAEWLFERYTDGDVCEFWCESM